MSFYILEKMERGFNSYHIEKVKYIVASQELERTKRGKFY